MDAMFFAPEAQTNKSFLVLFFKKEPLASLLYIPTQFRLAGQAAIAAQAEGQHDDVGEPGQGAGGVRVGDQDGGEDNDAEQ